MDWILVTSILKKGLRSLKNRLFVFLLVLACLEGISPANRDITGPKRSNGNSQVQEKGWGKGEKVEYLRNHPDGPPNIQNGKFAQIRCTFTENGNTWGKGSTTNNLTKFTQRVGFTPDAPSLLPSIIAPNKSQEIKPPTARKGGNNYIYFNIVCVGTRARRFKISPQGLNMWSSTIEFSPITRKEGNKYIYSNTVCVLTRAHSTIEFSLITRKEGNNYIYSNTVCVVTRAQSVKVSHQCLNRGSSTVEPSLITPLFSNGGRQTRRNMQTDVERRLSLVTKGEESHTYPVTPHMQTKAAVVRRSGMVVEPLAH